MAGHGASPAARARIPLPAERKEEGRHAGEGHHGVPELGHPEVLRMVVAERQAARERFELAAYLFPTAQSPWLALSQLASRAGDTAA